MTVLLKEAMKPNLVQTIEGQPAFVHCGPFANIAHGNSSLVADRSALKLGDYVVTEAGFGADMGMEKFFDIVCRARRARAERGRARRDGAGAQSTTAATRRRARASSAARATSRATSDREGVRAAAPVVAVNRFPTDTDAELEHVRRLALELGALGAAVNEGFERGGEGAVELAEAVVELAAEPAASFEPRLRARRADRAEDRGDRHAGLRRRRRRASPRRGAADDRAAHASSASASLPICMAKTHLSLSHDPTLLNAPDAASRITGPRPAALHRAPAGSSRCAATCRRCRGSVRALPRSTSTSMPTAASSACSRAGAQPVGSKRVTRRRAQLRSKDARPVTTVVVRRLDPAPTASGGPPQIPAGRAIANVFHGATGSPLPGAVRARPASAGRSRATARAFSAPRPDERRKGPCPRGLAPFRSFLRPAPPQPPRRLDERLGEHLHVREHRHEVRVARPARNDVQVDVVDDPGARGAAEVPADVVAPAAGTRSRVPPGRWP